MGNEVRREEIYPQGHILPREFLESDRRGGVYGKGEELAFYPSPRAALHGLCGERES